MMRRLFTVCAVVLLSVTGSLRAQRPYSQSWGNTDNPRVKMIARPESSDSKYYLLNPGHYVQNPSDRSDYWSPHYRAFPDYSDARSPRTINPLPRNRLGGAWGGAQVGYPYQSQWNDGACGGGYGCDHAPLYSEAAEAYNQGRYDADQEYLWAISAQRAGRLINQSADFFDEGILLFRDGQYDRAAIKWLGAGDVNQGSAATRLHAGHAMFALGRYAESVTHLARAFELSPSLAYKSFDIRDEYGDLAEFDRHLARLKDYVTRYPHDPAARTLLGYVLFYTDGPAPALPHLEYAGRLDPNSFFIPKLLTLARQASPAEGVQLPRRASRPVPAPAYPAAAPATSPRRQISTPPPYGPAFRPAPPKPRAKPNADPSEKVKLVMR
ncbi:MAG: hypothetical protein DCC65_10245 [Planctomycetota bacterium]|nr:MAG: hypothetical protein DCC65_10245 [Planctomycetota bacterium]